MRPVIVDSTTPADEGPFVVGKEYVRPVILAPNGYILAILDGHVGDVSKQFHYHADMRFVPFNYRINPTVVLGVMGIVGMARCLCVREHAPPIDCARDRKDQVAFRMVERQQRNKVCKGKVCPHQGCDLTTVKPNLSEDGHEVLTCPCHGLQWSTTTGEMVRRRKPLPIRSVEESST